MPPTSTPCSSSAASITTSIRGGIERYLLVAWESGATPVIVLNKADLVDDPQRQVDEMRALAPAVDVHAVSARQAGITDAVARSIWPSGAPARCSDRRASASPRSSTASSVTNCCGRSEVRDADSRGRHTSTQRQLVLLPGGGLLIDTPGMRELQLWDSGER